MVTEAEDIWLAQHLYEKKMQIQMMKYNKADVVFTMSVTDQEKLDKDALENGPTIQEEF